MSHLYKLEDAAPTRPSLVTIGVFDGLHKGHQTLIARVVAAARAAHYDATVLTFHPHPDVVLRGITDRYYLTTPEQRAALLQEMGVDRVVTYPFDDAARQISATDFVDDLLEHLNMKALWVGADFAMGYKRQGNVAFLKAYGEEKGFTVEAIPLVAHTEGDEVVSSSRIRELLAEGNVDTVHDWLGRAYAVQGKVVQGDQRGRTIGFPTANLDVWSQQIVPAYGVYACWARFNGETHMAVTNIGVRPTFNGENATVEAHLLGFDKDIYGVDVELSFEKRLRGEMKFNGIDALVAQIQQDAVSARTYLQSVS
ncbi:bifunctional riboflavin kinase/FAD synthetase [Phototrophicus methaneseepsis]|uniref:Riboflavin biosynthesis protein n=1 Tax=Phototrophicus methaneseepsis TaxID=2710758 RepID=A0A7S8E729_9CHLR|nr:bifunctional riboflavin kinase/FAD synthetase [Phototrophicus methaneseepsis]QPC81565.1 bifunctional riboflavin kinase/FAD synthetase [Phototrophicus methaneseepsis]